MNSRALPIVVGMLMLAMMLSRAHAGDLDFVDPCLKARTAFNSQQSDIMGRLDAALANAHSLTATPPDVADKLWASIRSKMRAHFDQHVAPLLIAKRITPTDQHFALWFAADIAAEGGKGKFDDLMLSQYRTELTKALTIQKEKTAAALTSQRSDLDSKCPMDAGNQALRILLTAATSPITIVGNNLEGAKHEPGVLNQVVHATTGISIPDIVQHGLAGGDGSVVNDVGRFFSHVFGW